MDNMAVGWDRPQEDEFALCALGLPSPYLRCGFPNRPQDPEYLDLKGVPPEGVAHWRAVMLRFVQSVAYRFGRRLVLKSPTHTARVTLLREMFPSARFIHIVRRPEVLYASTEHMWRKMFQTQHIQTPRPTDLEDFVFETLVQMYDAFEEARPLLPDNRYFEVRYEDLIADPLGQLQAMYRQLELGDFEPARAGAQQYLRQTSDYQTNRFDVSAELQAKIRHRWAAYAQRYGYA